MTTFRSLTTSFYPRNDQIDSGNISSEFRRSIRTIMATNSVDVVSMFFHSFQFLNWRKHLDGPLFSKQKWRTAVGNLDYLLSQDIEWITEDDLSDVSCNALDTLGPLDCSKGILPFFYFSLRAVDTIWARMQLNV